MIAFFKRNSEKVLIALYTLFIPLSIVGVNASIPGYESFFLARIVLLLLTAVVVTSLLVTWKSSKEKVLGLLKERSFMALGALVLVSLASLLWAQESFLAVRYSFLLVTGALFYALTILIVDNKERQRLFLRAIIFSVGVAMVISFGEIINQYFRMPNSNLIGKPERFLVAVTSFFKNQNDFSTFLSLMLPIALAPVIISKERKIQLAGFFSSFLILFVSSFNNSRVNTLALGAFGVALLIYLMRKHKDNVSNWIVLGGAVVAYAIYTLSKLELIYINGYLPIGVLVVFLAVTLYEVYSKKDSLAYLLIYLMLILFLVPSFGPQLKSYAAEYIFSSDISKEVGYNEGLNEIDLSQLENAGENSLSIRVNMFKNTFKELNKSPERYLLGVGAGNIDSYMDDYEGTRGIVNLHNWWLEIFANLGLVGAGLIAMFSLYLFWKNLNLFLIKEDMYSFISASSLFVLAIVAMSPSSMTWQIFPWFVYSFAAVNYLINKKDYEDIIDIPYVSNKGK